MMGSIALAALVALAACAQSPETTRPLPLTPTVHHAARCASKCAALRHAKQDIDHAQGALDRYLQRDP